MKVAEAGRQFQVQLEAVRAAFASNLLDDEERGQALEDLGRARDQLEVAWLEDRIAA